MILGSRPFCLPFLFALTLLPMPLFEQWDAYMQSQSSSLAPDTQGGSDVQLGPETGATCRLIE
jgi:hypothetical protein